MMTIDVRRAYFYAPAQRAVYIQIPAEDREPGDEGMVGRLNLSLYGTRDAAMNWSAEYTRTLESHGFVKGVASPCNFRHPARGIDLTVHGDDFLIVGVHMALRWFKGILEQKYDIKSQILGPELTSCREIKILNRIIRWTPHGLEYEPDQRHADAVIESLGLQQARTVSTPLTTESDDGEPGNVLNAMEASHYRSVCARINFLAHDRPDLQFASKFASKFMANPTDKAMAILKRIGRYLGHAP